MAARDSTTAPRTSTLRTCANASLLARLMREGPRDWSFRMLSVFLLAIGTLKVALKSRTVDLFGSQIQGDLIGASQWRIYQGVAKEFGSATSDSFP
jgi:hypothetical protein